MPRVSVIIPTYNRAQFLPEAVESVFKQTYRDFEIIIIDDGSTDNTPEIIRQFSTTVKSYRQKNEGVSVARNKGVELAAGEYLCFLDSDDLLLENALQNCVTFLDQHPEVGLCYGRVHYIDEQGNLIWWKKMRGEKKDRIRDGKEQIACLLFRGDMNTSAVLVRRGCLEEAGIFDPSLHLGQDIDMWLRVCQKYPIGYFAEPLVKMRIHPKSTTEQKTLKELEGTQTAFVEHALLSLEAEPAYHHLRRKAYFGLYCYFAEEAARTGRYSGGLRYALKAIRSYPALLFHKDGASFIISVARSFLPKRFRQFAKRTLRTL